MKASDYIVEYLIKKGITHVFGYPGGMVTHLMDSFSRFSNHITAQVSYHEQGAAFAACGYAQVTGKPGVAYATSGPGATNLITGICNAYFDSIPTVFITGQVNTFESKASLGVRQRGFQETDIVSMVSSVTKYAAYVEDASKLKFYLDNAFAAAQEGRGGPVLLDIPMNVFRAEIDPALLETGIPQQESAEAINLEPVEKILRERYQASRCPCLLVGNGVKLSRQEKRVKRLAEKLNIPVVTSMIAFDVLGDSPNCYGFIGAYGSRTANFVVAKSDLVIAIGSRMDIRQVGAKRESFAPDAKILRFDVDAGELSYPVHPEEESFCLTMDETLSLMEKLSPKENCAAWQALCRKLKQELNKEPPSLASKTAKMVAELSDLFPENAVITTDVGQNQVWIAQSLRLKSSTNVLFSGGHGAMGYSLPAAIGACFGSGKAPVICVSGDGGLQMNIQELQWIVREQLPVKIIVFNNNALGMIRHFQEMYFQSNFFHTRPEGGYLAPCFIEIGKGYGLRSVSYGSILPAELAKMLADDKPLLMEIPIDGNTYVFPKLEFGKPNQDQEPLLDREIYQKLMNLSLKDFGEEE